MTVMTTLRLPPAVDGWTVDDLDDLPEGLHYELVDGVLHVSPPASLPHNAAATELAVLLHPVVGPEWRVIAPAGVVFDLRNVREPDLIVLRRDGARAKNARPQDVLLAVEVMSPSSRTNDRLVKPTQYAAAGIRHYWRLEPLESVLITHVLDGDAYRETGRFVDEVVLHEPVALTFRLGDLLV